MDIIITLTVFIVGYVVLFVLPTILCDKTFKQMSERCNNNK